jgi:hypothetical protein
MHWRPTNRYWFERVQEAKEEGAAHQYVHWYWYGHGRSFHQRAERLKCIVYSVLHEIILFSSIFFAIFRSKPSTAQHHVP